MSIRFHKYHALGNDYLVLDPRDWKRDAAPSPEEIRKICHRHYGLGSDGILYGPGLVNNNVSNVAFPLRIFNPDGSEAEKSGNGLRIFARYIVERGHAPEGEPFRVLTPGGVAKCTVFEAGVRVRVGMGRVSFSSKAIPVNPGAPEREVLNEQLSVGGREFTYCAATIGNPHCVVPVEVATPELANKYGPLIETHPNFPNRTNVQFLEVLDRANIRIEIWERGAGYTFASGSSSSAAAAVAHKLGFVGPDVTVHMPGGVIQINIAKHYEITMTGPVTHVGTYEMAPDVLSQSI